MNIHDDLKGLAAEIGSQGWAAFQKLQTLKALVLATDAQAIIWI